MASLDGPIFAPAPDLPLGSRNALVIATSSYTDARLSQLRSPVKDAEDLAAVLADPAIGGFKVTTLIDSTESRIRRGIAAFLAGRGPDETVLVYLSCHGIQDAHGRLLFAATDTEADFPNATAVRAATDLLDELDECAASRQILILDCCFSGSFSDSKGGRKGELNLERQLRGHSRGREVLTASRGFEYSFEGEPLDGAITGSVFTTGLVQGLRTGAADTDKNGHITVEEAYEYAFAYVRGALAPQTPQRWLFSSEGTKIILARSVAGRAVTPVKLPEDLAHNLESRFPEVRIGAVNELARWLTDVDPARALAASYALRDVAENDLPRVAQVASSHLERLSPPEVTAPEPAAIGTAEPLDGVSERWTAQTSTTVLEGRGMLTSLAFSRDGALLVSSGGDTRARLWDLQTGGSQIRFFGGEGRRFINWMGAVAFSPDGLLLASGGEDHKVRLWKVATGGQVRILGRHVGKLGWVRTVAFSPDGLLLASGGEDHKVRLWEVATGTQVKVMAGHIGHLQGVAFSPDGKLLVSCGNDPLVRLWDVGTGELIQALAGHAGYVNGVAFSPDGGLLASCGDDRMVRLWDPGSGKSAQVLVGHNGPVLCVAFHPAMNLLASAGADYRVRLWDVPTGEALRTLDGHTKAVNSVAFSPTAPLLATAGNDRTIRLWR